MLYIYKYIYQFFFFFFSGVLVAQPCQTLCDPMDCSLPGSFVRGILQERILEWVAIPFCRGSFDPGIKPGSLTLQVGCLLSELPGKPSLYILIICDSLYILIYMVVYIHIYVYVYPSI